jgi:hypothetical protein
MKFFIFILFLFVSLSTCSQEKFSREISLITDNDLYVSSFKDRYYTSGIFLTYRQLLNSKKNLLDKRIYEWQIGHKMYTPYKSVVNSPLEHDRPFAGYLYAGFGMIRAYKNYQILKTSLQVGVIGSNSFARELQEFIHNIYDFRKATGWKYQIKNAFGLNFNTNYLKTVVNSKKKYFDISWINSLNLGSVITNTSSGFYTRIGFIPLQKSTNSIAFNTNLNNKHTNYFRETESFLYVKSMLNYVFYDATLQGSFLNKTSPITKKIKPLILDIEIGLKFTINRLNFGYVFIYNTKKSEGLRYKYGDQYGRITINYLLP